MVEVAGKQKRTAEASGEEMQRSEETLEFLIGGDVADRPDAAVHVEVWDNTFVADDEVHPFIRPSVTWLNERRRATLQFQVNLASPMHNVGSVLARRGHGFRIGACSHASTACNCETGSWIASCRWGGARGLTCAAWRAADSC